MKHDHEDNSSDQLDVEVADGTQVKWECLEAALVAAVGLTGLAIVIVSIVGESDTATLLSSRRVPASSNVGVWAKTTTREQTIAAGTAGLSATDGLDLLSIGVEEKVTVEVS